VSFFEETLAALNEREVRCVVVGGLAVILHGHLRTTIDLDIVIDLAQAEAAAAMEALTSIGLRPAVPVDASEFADPAKREGWIREKHMKVFPLRDLEDITRRVDVFVQDPIPFDDLWSRSVVVPYGGTTARIASIDDLIAMKREAGRTQDLADIEVLEEIKRHERRG
jgi:hypothetical protein